MEEEIEQGGLGMLLSAVLKDDPAVANKKVEVFALQNPFCVPAQDQTVREAAGLDAAQIAKKIQTAIGGSGEPV